MCAERPAVRWTHEDWRLCIRVNEVKGQRLGIWFLDRLWKTETYVAVEDWKCSFYWGLFRSQDGTDGNYELEIVNDVSEGRNCSRRNIFSLPVVFHNISSILLHLQSVELTAASRPSGNAGHAADDGLRDYRLYILSKQKHVEMLQIPFRCLSHVLKISGEKALIWVTIIQRFPLMRLQELHERKHDNMVITSRLSSLMKKILADAVIQQKLR